MASARRFVLHMQQRPALFSAVAELIVSLKLSYVLSGQKRFYVDFTDSDV